MNVLSVSHSWDDRYPHDTEEAYEMLLCLLEEWRNNFQQWENSWTNFVSGIASTTDIVNLANAYNHLSRKYFCEALLNVCREERENSRFIPKEDEYLLELKADKGLNTEQIAAILGRTPFAIQTRCSSLFGIKNKSKPVDGIFKGVIKTTESGETDISGRVWKRE